MSMSTMIDPRPAGLVSPAELFIKWSGGVEAVKDSTTGDVTKEGGYPYILVYNEDDDTWEKQKIDMPLTIYPLGEAMQVTGGKFQVNKLSSNEFGDWDETVRVFNKTEGAERGELVAKGTYSEIKDVIKGDPYYGVLQRNLYCLVKIGDAPQIARFEMRPSAAFALDKVRKTAGSNAFFERPLVINGAEYRKQGGIDYAVPAFTQGEPYTEDALNKLMEYAKQINEYGSALHERNLGYADLKDELDNAFADDDTEPTDRTGDTEVKQEDSPVDVSDIPF